MAFGKVVLVFVIIPILVGIGGMVCGAYGSFWYTASYTDKFNVNIGLWQMCKFIDGNNSECTKREDLFKFTVNKEFLFKVNTQTYDIVLVLIIGAGGFGCIALLFTFILCCVRSPRGWRTVSTFIALLVLLAALSSAGAVAYADIFIRRKMPETEKNLYIHGWSSILAWVGGGVFILAFVMSIVLCFVLPRKPYSSRYGYDDNNEEFRYKANPNSAYNTMNNGTAKNTINRTQFTSYENVGYEMK